MILPKLMWEDIPDYEGLYQVNQVGQIRSLKFGKKKRLKFQENEKGYLCVKLYKNGKRKEYKVHRLVASTFIPNVDNLPVVNHKNGVKSDNRVENLEWTSYSGNNQHAYDTGLRKALTGEKNPRAKKIICLTTSEIFNCSKEAGERYGIKSYCNIATAAKKQKSYGKHPETKEKLYWRYAE